MLSFPVEPEHKNRIAWIFFQHTAFAVGNEVHLELDVVGGNNVRLPVWTRPATDSHIGFAASDFTDNTLVPGPGSLFWNNTTDGAYRPIHPIQLPTVPAREVRLVGKFAAGTIRALIAIQSTP